jgi:prevent-host-death family protein
MDDGTWSVAEAKAKFSELLDRAETHGPQRVTRNGKPAGVVVSQAAWDKRAAAPTESLADFMDRSPLRGSGIEFERMRGKMRDFEF